MAQIIMLGIGMALLISAIVAIPVCILWNILMPTICGFASISIFQAFGLTLLFSLLTGFNSSSK